MSDAIRIGTVTRVSQAGSALLVEIAAAEDGAVETLVHPLPGGDADRAQIDWYESVRGSGAAARFECTRSSPLSALRIVRAVVHVAAEGSESRTDDARLEPVMPAEESAGASAPTRRGAAALPTRRTHIQVSRVLRHATEILRRVG
jgi:hypothetical protein